MRRPSSLALAVLLGLAISHPAPAHAEELLGRLGGLFGHHDTSGANEIEEDDGTPTVAEGGKPEIMVVTVGAPDAGSPEHLFMEKVASHAHADTILDGAYGIDGLVDAIADPRRKTGERPKITTLFFVGHMIYAPDAADVAAKTQNPKLHPYILAGKSEYASAINEQFVAAFEAAMKARGLTPSDIFAPDALVELKVCDAGRDTRGFLDAFARDLPRGATIKAYDETYVWRGGAYDFLWSHDKPYRLGMLGELFGERPAFKWHLGDQKNGMVEIPGTFDPDALPLPPAPSAAASAAGALAGQTTTPPSSATTPAATPGITGTLRHAE